MSVSPTSFPQVVLSSDPDVILEVHHVSKRYRLGGDGEDVHALCDISLTELPLFSTQSNTANLSTEGPQGARPDDTPQGGIPWVVPSALALARMHLRCFSPIRKGEFVMIRGPSGGGKTTLLHLLGTLDQPTSGEVVLMGHRLSASTPDSLLSAIRRRHIGFVFQTFNLLPSMTALENVELPMALLNSEDTAMVPRERGSAAGAAVRLGPQPRGPEAQNREENSFESDSKRSGEAPERRVEEEEKKAEEAAEEQRARHPVEVEARGREAVSQTTREGDRETVRPRVDDPHQSMSTANDTENAEPKRWFSKWFCWRCQTDQHRATWGSATWRKTRAKQLLALVGLRNRMNHLPSELSGGEQQRVTIARALANAPSILLLDEPTGDLDTATTVDIMQLLMRLNRGGDANRRGVTLVMVTHNPDLECYADRVLYMEDGMLVKEAVNKTPMELDLEKYLIFLARREAKGSEEQGSVEA